MTAADEKAEAAAVNVGVGVGAKGWLQRCYLAMVFLTTIAYGSASTFQAAAAALGFSILIFASLVFSIGSARVRRIHGLAAILAFALFAYAVAQSVPIGLSSPFAHPAWAALSSRFGVVRGFVSVAPGMTLSALPSLSLPFLAFLSALTYFQGDDEAVFLWRALAWFGVGYAAYGIVQEVAFPEALLFETKTFYRGSLTSTFVNRNTAGTFFGLALILNLSLLFHELKSVRLTSFLAKATNFDIKWPSAYARGAVYLICVMMTGVALFLTQSRGAVGATFVTSVLAVFLFALRPLTADKPMASFAAWRRRASIVGVLVAVAGAFAVFGERSAYRMQEQGTDDARWCAFASSVEAIRDNWPLGAGFGAFQDVFPVYRHSECAGIFGVWERAHDFYLEGMLGFGLLFLVGLVVAVAGLALAFIRGLRTRRRMRFLSVGGMAALCLVALHNLVDFSLQIPGFNVYFAATMAAAITASLGR